MQNFHLTPDGPKLCSAESTETCFYGGEHFNGLFAAVKAFEKSMSSQTLPPATSQDLQKIAETESMIPSATSWREVSIKDMDAGALTAALNTEMQDHWENLEDKKAFDDALGVASYLHRDQTRANRKGFNRTPYVEHPLRNTLRLVRMGFTDKTTLIASVLHDTVEDCAEEMTGNRGLDKHKTRKLALLMMENRFGSEVADAVSRCSNPIVEHQRTKAEKRAAYKAHITESITTRSSFAVKLADFKDNAGGLHHNFVEGNESMVSNMFQKYSPCVQVFQKRLEELRPVMSDQEHTACRKALDEISARLTKLGEILQSKKLKS